MSLSIKDIQMVEEIIEKARLNDMSWMTTTDFIEFEDNVLHTLYEYLENN